MGQYENVSDALNILSATETKNTPTIPES